MNEPATASSVSAGAPSGNPPPGLEVVSVGFDASTWTFKMQTIFALTYGQGRSVTLIHGMFDARYDVPDGMQVRQHYVDHASEARMFHGVDSSDEQRFSLALSASLGAEIVSAATQDSIETESRIARSASQSTTLISQYKTIYEFGRLNPDNPGTLTDSFVDALQKLPAIFDAGQPANTNEFKKFFTTWGTHYLDHGFFGGNYIMNVALDRSVFDRLTADKIKGSIKTSFDAGVDKGAAGVDIEKSTRDGLKVTDEQCRAETYSTGGTGGGDVKSWREGVSRGPELLFDAISVATRDIAPTFRAIYLLADDNGRREALRQALRAYLPPGEPQGSVFGPAVVETPNPASTVLATSNGFAVLCVTQESRSWNYATITGQLTQSSTGPVLGQGVTTTSMDDRPVIDQWIPRGSAILPVCQGTYYTKTYSGVAPTSAFLPTTLQFGPYQPLAGLDAPAQTDGLFVVSWIADGPQLTAGTVEFGFGPVTVGLCVDGWQTTPNGSDVKVSSLCIPVPQGAVLKRNDRPFWGDMNYGMKLGWFPLTDLGRKFGDVVTLSPNHTYTAATDGFAFATAKVDQDGARGVLEIRTFNSANQPDPLYATCSVHKFRGTNKFIDRSTIMLPVADGKTWSTAMTPSVPPMDANVYWMPVVSR